MCRRRRRLPPEARRRLDRAGGRRYARPEVSNVAKDLDQELEKALRATDEEAAAAAVVAPVRPAPRKAAPANVPLLIGLLVIAAGVVGAVMFGFKEGAIYALGTEQLVDRSEEMTGRRVRVEGELVPGTLVKRDDPCEFRFRMRALPGATASSAEIPVVYPQCVIPDTFRDRPEGGVEVTVEGTLQKAAAGGAQEFKATLVMAKCSSKYDPATGEMIEPDGSRRKALPSEIEAAGQPIR
jgi:cytochrome c-type biogenesis protein CcmE